MSLDLDERRVAMLREMGLRLLPPIVQARHAIPAAAPVAQVAARTPTATAAPAAIAADMQPVAEGDNPIIAVGPERADWLFIGDRSGQAERDAGQAFAGQAGQLLDNMLRAMRLDRDRSVRLASVREAPGCEPFLRREVERVRPRIILAMGRFAVQSLLQTQEPVGKLRGRVHAYEGIPLVVTYHPAYLLRNLADKAKAWSDLCLALEVVAGADQPSASGL